MVAVPTLIAVGLSAASAAAGVAGTAISADNQARQAKQAAATADYNAQVEQRNAYAERQSQQAQDDQTFQENNQRLGAIRAMYGASGLDATGTPLDVLQGNASQMAYQTNLGDYTEQLKQMGYSSEVTGLQQQAQADRQQASYATGAALGVGLTSSLVGSASKFSTTDTGKALLAGL